MGQVMSKLEAGLVPTVVLWPLCLVHLTVVYRTPLSVSQPYLFHSFWPSFSLFWQLLKTTRCWWEGDKPNLHWLSHLLPASKMNEKHLQYFHHGIFITWLVLSEAAWKVSCIWKCSIIQWRVLNAKEVQDWIPHLQGICYFHKAQTRLFRFCFALIHWYFTLIYELSFSSYRVLWREKLHQLF